MMTQSAKRMGAVEVVGAVGAVEAVGIPNASLHAQAAHAEF